MPKAPLIELVRLLEKIAREPEADLRAAQGLGLLFEDQLQNRGEVDLLDQILDHLRFFQLSELGMSGWDEDFGLARSLV